MRIASDLSSVTLAGMAFAYPPLGQPLSCGETSNVVARDCLRPLCQVYRPKACERPSQQQRKANYFSSKTGPSVRIRSVQSACPETIKVPTTDHTHLCIFIKGSTDFPHIYPETHSSLHDYLESPPPDYPFHVITRTLSTDSGHLTGKQHPGRQCRWRETPGFPQSIGCAFIAYIGI